MDAFPAADAIRHQAFEPWFEVMGAETARADIELTAAHLGDRARMAVLLQGAAVLAHLAHAGWFLPRGWDGAGLAADGALRLPPPASGRARELPQQSLLGLVELLFEDSEVKGRSETRRALRGVIGRLRHALAPVAADRAVADLLTTAPFLWEPPFAAARQALVAELRRGGPWLPWVVGPGIFRRRLLKRVGSAGAARELLATREARELWEEAAAAGARELAGGGSRRAALTAWEIVPPASAEERLERARSLAALGRYQQALDATGDLRSAAARLLRAECQIRLGRLGAALAGLRRLAAVELTPVETLTLAELAVRSLANLGQLEGIPSWVEKAKRAGSGDLAPRAELLAAVAAWDLGNVAAAERHLEACRAALAVGDLAWRWWSVASLVARAKGELREALGQLGQALGSRRRRTHAEAGELWNEVGICRAGLGDLAGAERAFLHTVRLIGGSEGPRPTTLALYNLAEIRLRRGRLQGVREILEEVSLENRLAANLRGTVQDLELWARYELAQGRCQAALEHCRAALGLLAAKEMTFRRGVLQVLAARALGWLGRSDEARDALAEADRTALAEIEPEERPALFALAGDREAALLAAGEGPCGGLWQTILLSGEPPTSAWEALAGLEPYRAARLVLDAELVSPGSTPVEWRHRAAATLQRVGAPSLAGRLEASGAGPWPHLESFLGKTAGPEAWERLFADCGHPEARLVFRHVAGEVVLAAGAGGGEELAAEVPGGRLVLAACAVNPLLRVLLALARRDLEARLATPPEEEPAAVPRGVRPAGAAGHGFVGGSARLQAAVARLTRLAAGDLPILILGESGTGKELAAQLVHRESPRAAKPFVPMNCAAVSENLLLSDLFGHVRGAFTGADRDRAGVFEAAQGGTVFLDEIGDLPLAAQGMLLRVLQEGEVRRVGESLARKVRVRVVAATHRDLAQMVERGSFRQDLLFRLKVASAELPPLRERREDISLLAAHFLAAHGGAGARRVRLGTEALAALGTHSWPGNVRELSNVLAVAVALAGGDGGTIEPRHLDLPQAATRSEAPPSEGSYHARVDRYRRRLIEDALAAAGGNRARAARGLGMSRQAFSFAVRQLKLV